MVLSGRFLLVLLQLCSLAVSAHLLPKSKTYERDVEREVDASNTEVWVRFQIPRTGQSTKDARVTTLKWDSTVASVTATCVNFFNIGGTNDQLWRRFDISTLQYAGLFSAPCLRGMSAQSGLDGDAVAVSFILPSGVKKLKTIGPDTTGNIWTPTNRDAVSGIFGISGTLDASDFSYASVSVIKDGLRDWEPRKYTDDKELRLSTIKSNGNTVPIKLGLIA